MKHSLLYTVCLMALLSAPALAQEAAKVDAAPVAAPASSAPVALAPTAAPPAEPLPAADAAATAAPVAVDQPVVAEAEDHAAAEKPVTKTTKKKKKKKKHTATPAPHAEPVAAPTPGIATAPAYVRPLPKSYLVVKKESDMEAPDARLAAARAALAQNRYDAALEMFNDMANRDPSDKRVLMGRAVALQNLGQTDQALAAYEDLLRLDPQNVEALTNMLGLLKNQDQQTAIERLLQLRDFYPTNPDITTQLGMVYGQSGEYEKALKYLQMADSLNPGNPSVLYNQAVVYDRMGRTRQASDMYRRILSMANSGELPPGFPIAAVKKRLATIR